MNKLWLAVPALCTATLLTGCVIKPATPEGIEAKCDQLRADGRAIPRWCPPPGPPPPPVPPPPPPPPPGGTDRPPTGRGG